MSDDLHLYMGLGGLGFVCFLFICLVCFGFVCLFLFGWLGFFNVGS